MRITYAKTGGETRVYEYDSDDLLMSEVKAIEEAAGASLDTVETVMQGGSITERVIILWVLMKRENPRLKFADLAGTVRKREITVEFDRKERQALRERIGKSTLSDDDKAAALAQLDAEDAADPPLALLLPIDGAEADGPKEA